MDYHLDQLAQHVDDDVALASRNLHSTIETPSSACRLAATPVIGLASHPSVPAPLRQGVVYCVRRKYFCSGGR